jgi:hypothetical protein
MTDEPADETPSGEPGELHVERPESVVLGSEAVVPTGNIISPPPNQFTHELTSVEPYYYGSAAQGRPSDGTMDAGTRLILMRHEGGPYCRVADADGLYVEIRYESLRPLSPQ